MGFSTVREVEVHQGPVGVASANSVTEQAPTMNSMIPAPQCATVCKPLPLQGHTVSVPLLVQSASVAAPMLVQGTFLPITRGQLSCQWPVSQCCSRERRQCQHPCRAPVALLQGADMPAMAGAPLLNQSMPYTSAYMAPPAWPMHMPSYLPRPQIQQSSTQAKREQLAMQRQGFQGWRAIS